MPFFKKFASDRTGASHKGDVAQKNKFHNRKVTFEGVEFDSVFELELYKIFKQLKVEGLIKEVIPHPPLIELLPNQYLDQENKKDLIFKKLEIMPDFLITLNNDDNFYMDSKAWITITDEFIIKSKLFYYLFQKQIIVITKSHLPYLKKIIKLLETNSYRNCVSEKAFKNYAINFLGN